MANPTTNFGWVMPSSTSLVTNLPADFNTFGQGVDTSLQYLLGGTTGQVLSKTSGTNMAFTWVTPTDQTPLTTKGDLFAFSTVDARLAVGANETRLVADSTQTVGLKYVADTTNYAINAKGDLLAGTAADTLQALSVGTNGQYLQADSTTATGLKWATASGGGSLTLLSTTTLSGASTTVSSISGSYTNLFITIEKVTNATGNGGLIIDPNASATITSSTVQSTNTSQSSGSQTYSYLNNRIQGNYNAIDRTNDDNFWALTIYNYASTVTNKSFIMSGGYGGATYNQTVLSNGFIKTLSAITSMKFANDGGNLSTGTVKIYGVN